MRRRDFLAATAAAFFSPRLLFSQEGFTPQEPAWTRFPVQRAMGRFTTAARRDTESHLYNGHHYAVSGEEAVSVHEETHGINGWISNQYSGDWQAFYVFDDKAVVVPEAPFTMQEVARRVPQSLRGFIYREYVVKNCKESRQLSGDTLIINHYQCPLYVFDEWAAYLNGAMAEIELAKSGKFSGTSSDIDFGLQMAFCCLAALEGVIAVGDKYVYTENLKAFTLWNWARMLRYWEDAAKVLSFYPNPLPRYQLFQTSKDADIAQRRDFWKEQFGSDAAKHILRI